ncbi:MAG TPA: Asp-tRNA(Asn)/Glu-tRNA(Gln) amidotransferase subunit GatB [Firmicutes bacterium]|nr:Asp-tRNA(Asn)/Glu-tRNA(Gln) amidotransferase subunit GatB [Candidatus Fermentithermobacillaceae bacterium]
MSETQYELNVGLEVHVELATASKMFCRCKTKFGDPPNTNVCPVCMGLPGALPVANEEAVRLGVMAALALNCRVNLSSRFDRKNYFYPDLPKAYQISQFEEPLAVSGYVELASGKRIRIRRLHLEEDAGKSMHAGDDITTASYSLLDYNRSGVPLAEIVSEPDISSPEEAREYLEKMQRTLRFAGVSDVKMEEGSMRVDCNVSVRRKGEAQMGVPVELKNLSSFRAVTRALAYEYDRQSRLIEQGKRIARETRHWDEDKGVTVSLRAKESSQDYRYFPDPDLPRLELDEAFIESVQRAMPRLPNQVVDFYVNVLGLPKYDAEVLTVDPNLVKFFDRCVELGGEPKPVSNWLMGDIMAYMNAKGLSYDTIPVTPENLVAMLGLIKDGVISGKIAKDVLIKMFETGKAPGDIVKEEGLEQVSDDASLSVIVDSVIAANPEVVAQFKAGKDKVLGFLVGQVMKASKGRANPAKVNIMLREKILS